MTKGYYQVTQDVPTDDEKKTAFSALISVTCEWDHINLFCLMYKVNPQAQ